MANYANAKIYQIISPNYQVPYIGSTTQPLSKRMVEHRSHHRHTCRSVIIIEAGDAYIELIEEYPCENREQLNKREGEIIRTRECVNYTIAGRTRNEWLKDNKERLKKKRNEYNEANKELVIEKRKAYNEKTTERRKAYNEGNKEQRNQKLRAKREKEKSNKQILCPTE